MRVRLVPVIDPTTLVPGQELLALAERPLLWTWLGPDVASGRRLVVERESGARRALADGAAETLVATGALWALEAAEDAACGQVLVAAGWAGALVAMRAEIAELARLYPEQEPAVAAAAARLRRLANQSPRVAVIR